MSDLIAEIRTRHKKVENRDRQFCRECMDDWPCDAIRAADALEVSQRALRLANESCATRDRIIVEGVETRKLALLPDSEVAVLVEEHRDRERALVAALRKLEREATGFMEAYEAQHRATAGNTNVGVMFHWIEHAREILAEGERDE